MVVEERHNWFVAGPPVVGEDFFGREHLVQLIRNCLQTDRSVLLIGERRIGKTSLLQQADYFMSRACDAWASNLITIHLDGSFFPAEDPERVLTHRIVRGLQRWHEKQPSSSVKRMSDLTVKQPDRTQLYQYLRTIRRQTNHRIVVLFDEMDSAILDAPAHVAGFVRGLISTGAVIAIASSFRDPAQIRQETHYGSPWYNVFQVEFLGLFSEKETRGLLTVLSGKSGREFTEGESRFLIDVFGRFPFFLQLAGWHAFSDDRFRSCDSRHRGKLLMETASVASRQLHWHFAYMVEHLTRSQIEVLLKIGQRESVSDCQKLGILRKRGIVVSTDDGYQIFAGAFTRFLERLPKPTIGEKTKEPTQGTETWERVLSVTEKVFETAVGKAIEIAAQKYL